MHAGSIAHTSVITASRAPILPFAFVPDLVDRILASDAVTDIAFSIELMTPILQPEGLDLMGIGRITNLRLEGIRTSAATPGFDDYLGLLRDFEAGGS